MRALEDAYTSIWRYERFVTTVGQRAGLTWNEAERAARATLETLGERLSWEDARALAEGLPDELKRWLLDTEHDAGSFDAAEFVARVARREGTDPSTAERDVEAVFVALSRLVRGDEMEALAAALPEDYAPLLAETQGRPRDPGAPETLPLGLLLRRVADRAGVDERDARRIAEAVLETLGERIAGGEVDDIAEYLPEELRSPLERGKERSGGRPQRMSLDEFVERIAEREDVPHDEALRHARAVFATLREALPPEELSDVLAELPRAYREALL